MPFDPQEYRDRSSEYLALAERLVVSDEETDRRWSIVIRHYSALQLVKAALIDIGHRPPPEQHPAVRDTFRRELEDRGLHPRGAAALQQLQSMSEDCRYLSRVNWHAFWGSDEVSAIEEAEKDYKRVEESVTELLATPGNGPTLF